MEQTPTATTRSLLICTRQQFDVLYETLWRMTDANNTDRFTAYDLASERFDELLHELFTERFAEHVKQARLNISLDEFTMQWLGELAWSFISIAR